MFSRVQLFATPWTIGSSVHGISQARIQEWVAIFYARGFPRPRNWTHVSCTSCICRQIFLPLSRFFTIIACWEDPFFDLSKSKVKIRRQLKWSSTYWKTITGKLGCYARQEYLSSKNKVISYLNKIWGSFPPTGIHWKKCRRVERQKERPSV